MCIGNESRWKCDAKSTRSRATTLAGLQSALAPKKKKLLHIGQYEIGRTLGEGSFSKVKLGTDIFTGQKVIVSRATRVPQCARSLYVDALRCRRFACIVACVVSPDRHVDRALRNHRSTSVFRRLTV
jgi:hypothetical protein